MKGSATQSFNPVPNDVPAPSFGFWERWVLRQSHPVAIMFRLLGVLWASYALWHNDLVTFFLVAVISRSFAVLATLQADYESLGRTVWGKIALLHLHPINLLTQLLGVFLLGVGLWLHDSLAILTAVTLIGLGHGSGWAEVHPSLRWQGEAP